MKMENKDRGWIEVYDQKEVESSKGEVARLINLFE
jgi:hypothetical protein